MKSSIKKIFGFTEQCNVLVVVIIFLLLLVGIIGILILVDRTSMSDQGLVISFFGIIATFIVIGNYTQVEQIRQRTEQEINKILDKNNKDSIISKLDNMRDELYDKDTDKPKYLSLTDEYDRKIDSMVVKKLYLLDNHFNDFAQAIFNHLIYDKYKEIFVGVVFQNEVYKCQIMTASSKRNKSAWMRREGDRIVFRDKNGDIIESITEVNGVAYNQKEMHLLLELWDKINKSIKSVTTIDDLDRLQESNEFKLQEQLKEYIDITKSKYSQPTKTN